MDAGRFDALSKSLANRSSRRSALRGFGAGGVTAAIAGALGGHRVNAASGTCALAIVATTAVGPHKGKKYTGTLNMTIDDKGAIDTGTFDTTDGQHFPMVGQASGRALNLRIKLGGSDVLSLDGTADIDLILCRGDAAGTFGGPSTTDLGTWRTGTGQATSGNAGNATSSGGGSTSSGGGGSSSGGGGSSSGGGGSSSGGGGNDSGGNSSGGGGGGDCPSGMVCGGVCCAPMAGLSADNITCNAGFCECTYSCASAGCNPNGTGSIVNTCGSDPQPHCHSECNVPTDNGCGDMTCDNGQTLDVDSCTCVSTSGGGGGCVQPLTNCGDNQNVMCADLQNDANNCGSCGNVCPSGQCIEGNCTDVVK